MGNEENKAPMAEKIDLTPVEVDPSLSDEAEFGKPDNDSKSYGMFLKAFSIIAALLALFHLYTAQFGILTGVRQRAVHLTIVLVLTFMIKPANRKKQRTNLPPFYDFIFMLGAIVSGAYFGDKMSPLSDTTNLAPAMAGATLFKHIKHMIYTTGTSLIIALIAYAIMGFMFASNNEADLSTMDMILGFIKEASIVNPLTLLPPLFVIVAVALKLPAIPALVVAALLGIPFFFMNSAFIEKAMGDPMMHNIFNILDYGISLGNVPDDASLILQKLSSLLSSSGMIGMFDTIAIILAAMCFGGILDVTGMMAQFAEKILAIAKGRGGLVLATELMCLITNAICCDQYLSLVLPGRMFKEKFEDMRLRPENLSRCLEDCGTITSNFFPWNTCGATMRKFLGIDSSYIPYAILNWLNPVVSIFFGYTGITMTKMTEEEYQHLLKVREEEKAVALAAMEA